jgi:hypothetical protein
LKDPNTNSIARVDLARALSALAARMGSGEAAQAAGPLAQALEDPKTTSSARADLARALSALAARMGRGKAAQAAGTLAREMSKTTDTTRLNSLAEAIVVTLTGLPPTRTATAAAAAVTSLADRSGWPMTLAVLTLVKDPPPCRLSTLQLVDLLKDPLCVGKARRVILDQLEIRFQREFADHWAFVRFAQNELTIDPTGPPPR